MVKTHAQPYKHIIMRDLGIYIDSDVSMRTHIMRTVSMCLSALRQLRSIRRSVSQPVDVLPSLVTSLILTRLDYDYLPPLPPR